MFKSCGINRAKRSDLKKALSQSVIDKKDGVNELRKIDALLRFYFKIDPDQLTDEAWADRWGELKYALEQDAKKWET